MCIGYGHLCEVRAVEEADTGETVAQLKCYRDEELRIYGASRPQGLEVGATVSISHNHLSYSDGWSPIYANGHFTVRDEQSELLAASVIFTFAAESEPQGDSIVSFVAPHVDPLQIEIEELPKGYSVTVLNEVDSVAVEPGRFESLETAEDYVWEIHSAELRHELIGVRLGFVRRSD
jgi:hypothetical protein